MSDLVAGLKALRDVRPGYDEAEQMYNGTVDEVIASAKIARALNKDGDKFRMNYARIVCTSRLDKLEISSVTSEDREAAALLEQWWTDKELADETHDTIEAAVEFGDAYMIVWPTEADESDSVTDFDVYFNGPQSVRAFYSAENPREMKYVIKVFPFSDAGQTKLRVNVYYPDRIERYISRSETTSLTEFDDSMFETYVDDAGTMLDDNDEEFEYPGTWPIPNPWNKIPVFHFRTARPYGRPEHRDAYGAQNAINKLIATQMGNVDYLGLPQRYAIENSEENGGVSEVDQDFADDEIVIGSDVVRDKGDDKPLKSEPGSVWWLKNVKEVGQFDAASASAFLDPQREFVQGMSVTTKTPLSAFRIGGQIPSGAARRADDAPLNGRVADLQRRLGATFKSMYRFILELHGIDADVALSWAPLETFDDKDTWEVATAQLEAGVPLRQVLLERGYTDGQCDDWGVPEFGKLSAKDQAAHTASAAATIRDLGTAQTLGSVSPETVQAVIEKMIGG
jgi:hypothetical protein